MSMFSALRPMAEQFMSDRCTINRPSTIEFDKEELEESDTAGDLVYSGKCQVRPLSPDTLVEVGEGPLTLNDLIVRVPVIVTGVGLHDVVTITASDDPHMVDRELYVVGVTGGTGAATRNLYCRNVTTEG